MQVQQNKNLMAGGQTEQGHPKIFYSFVDKNKNT